MNGSDLVDTMEARCQKGGSKRCKHQLLSWDSFLLKASAYAWTRAETTCIRHEPIIEIKDQFEMTKRVLDSSKVLEYHSCNVYFLLSAMRPWMILRCCAVLHFARTVIVCVQTNLEVSLPARFREVAWRNIATESLLLSAQCVSPWRGQVTLAMSVQMGRTGSQKIIRYKSAWTDLWITRVRSLACRIAVPFLYYSAEHRRPLA